MKTIQGWFEANQPDVTFHFCSHIESGETLLRNMPSIRYIPAGPKTAMILCPYCNGRLVKTILDELAKISIVQEPQ
jgi:hypothetical protein